MRMYASNSIGNPCFPQTKPPPAVPSGAISSFVRGRLSPLAANFGELSPSNRRAAAWAAVAVALEKMEGNRDAGGGHRTNKSMLWTFKVRREDMGV